MPLVTKSTSAKIIFLSSGSVNFFIATTFNKYLHDIGGEELSQTNIEVYEFSKAADALYAKKLQKRLFVKIIYNVVIVSVDPGFV